MKRIARYGAGRHSQGLGTLALVAWLAGCGGGSDAPVQGSDPATSPPPAASPGGPQPTPGASPGPVDGPAPGDDTGPGPVTPPAPAPVTPPAPVTSPAPSPVTPPAPDPGPAPGPAPGAGAGPDPVPAPDPQTPPPAILPAPVPAPVVDAAGNVSWNFGPQPSSVELIVQPYTEMPLDSSGRTPRLNVIATQGQRLFVAEERDGRIYDITSGSPVLWFDLGAALPAVTGRQLDRTETWHAGLRSIAFHPSFATNGRFYLSAMEQRPADPSRHRYLSDVAQPIVADGVVMEWTADPVTLRVDARSHRELFRVGMSTYDHTIKQIGFNPYAAPGSADFGKLYVAHGDGSEKSATVGGGLRNDALGKIIRIDPLQADSRPYSIPPDNPFTDRPELLDELWSIGHRNPHHLAFTRDGRLIVAEPGRDNIDEINLVERGQNYGWSDREGTFVHRAEGGLVDGIVGLPSDDGRLGYTYPVMQFGHTGRRGDTFVRQALGGGYAMENGSALDGRYFFCDFAVSGDIFFASLADMVASVTRGAPGALRQAPYFRARILFDQDANPATAPQPVASMLDVIRQASGFESNDGDPENDRSDLRFGRGPQGELYLMSKRNRMIYKVLNSIPGN